jgi:prevent-host-death family protein
LATRLEWDRLRSRRELEILEAKAEVIRIHGESGATARLEPATIDGLVYASSMVILYAARHRLAVPPLARWLLALGILATLAANVAHGWTEGPVGAVVAAWPAASLVGSYELLAWLVRTAADGALVQEQGLDQLMVQVAAEADPVPQALSQSADEAIAASVYEMTEQEINDPGRPAGRPQRSACAPNRRMTQRSAGPLVFLPERVGARCYRRWMAYPLTAAQAHLGELVAEARQTHRPVTISEHGKPVAALINIDDLADLEDRAALAAHLADKAAGLSGVSLEELDTALDRIDTETLP